MESQGALDEEVKGSVKDVEFAVDSPVMVLTDFEVGIWIRMYCSCPHRATHLCLFANAASFGYSGMVTMM